jgi:outer membrane scaffolding protein for murein synthesis (MipA/OmpV family)
MSIFPRRATVILRQLFALLLLLGVVLPAHAQTPSPLAEWEYSAGMQLRSYYLWGKLPDWDFNLGLGAEFEPKYDGASQYHILPGPSIDIRYKDVAFLSTGEGLGINLVHKKNYRAGLALTYDLGRAQHEDYQLRGVGDVQPGPELKGFGEYVWFPVTFRVDLRRSLGGYNGWVSDFSVYTPIIGSEKFFVLVGPSLTIVDGNYMQNYFGISDVQSQQSGYPQSGYPPYRAEGGLKQFSFGSSATWFFRDPWYLNVSSGLSRLLGDASHSPTTTENLQGVVSLTIGYDWH